MSRAQLTLISCGCNGMCDGRGGCQLAEQAKNRHSQTLIEIANEGAHDARSMRDLCMKQARAATGDRVCAWLSMARRQNQKAVRHMRTARELGGTVLHDYKPAEPKGLWRLIALTLATWALLAFVVFGIGFALGYFDAGAAEPDLLDVEGNVSAYLEEHPQVVFESLDGIDARVSLEPETSLGFVSSSGRNVQAFMTGLMLLDTAQTVVIAQTPQCLREGNNLASVAFGTDQPSSQRVLITNALYMVGHWALGAWLDRKSQSSNDWAIARRAYQVLTIVGHGWAIKENHRLGIRPFSAYDCDGRRL